jgi:hypothetical protein
MSNTSPSIRSRNVIRRYFEKMIDLDEQCFSEICNISLKIVDILKETGQCNEEDYNNVVDLILFTGDNITRSVYQLDMMVNPDDKISYDESKSKLKILKQYTTTPRDSNYLIKKEYRIDEIQELLFKTSFKITQKVHQLLHRNQLLDYWSE